MRKKPMRRLKRIIALLLLAVLPGCGFTAAEFALLLAAGGAVAAVTGDDSNGASTQPPAAATNPSPWNGAANQSKDVNISWLDGGGATSYDVYFGTNSTPDSDEFKGNQAGTTYEPGTLAHSTVYYWRIDSKNAAGTTTGDVWSFTTGGGTYDYEWSEESPITLPTARAGHGVAWDGSQVVLCGGGIHQNQSSTFYLTSAIYDTYTWDGSDWKDAGCTQSADMICIARFGFCYDGIGALLFGGMYVAVGGSSVEYNGKTFRFSGGSWSEVAATGPAARYDMAMAYNPGTGKVLLFGGRDASQNFGDVWEWDGSAWTELTGVSGFNPVARGRMHMASTEQGMLIFGGTSASVLGDTHILGGTPYTWTAMNSSSNPAARYFYAMGPDTDGNVAVLFGGGAGAIYDDTWYSDGNEWKEVTISGSKPPARWMPAMAYDRTSKEFIMFGGCDAIYNDFQDTWILKK
jgi:hypothetical protein